MPAYMDYPTIKGDSKEPNHYQWIPLLSVGWGTGGKASSNELIAIKYLDNTSARLQLEMNRGTPREVVIAMTKDEGQGEQDYLVLTLKEAIISTIQTNDGDKESLVFNFTGVDTRYIKAYGHGDKTGDFSEPE